MRNEDAHGELVSTELRLSQALLALQSVIAAADGHVELAIGAVLEGALRMVPSADGALIAVTEPAGLICKAARGNFESLTGRRLDGVTHSAELALSDGNFVYDPDVETGSGFAPVVVRMGVRSIAVVPIPFRTGHVGVLKIAAMHSNAFTEDHLLAIRLLAGPLALAFLGSAHLEESEGHESANRRFVATFEQAAVGMAHVGPDGSFLRVNERFCRIAGYSNDELLAGGFQQITHPDDLEIDEHHVAELIEGIADNYTLEKRYVRRDGDIVWVNLTVSLVRDQAGAPEALIQTRRLGDRLARLGGDEFVIILPLADADTARHLIERACEAVKTGTGACGWPISVSAGAVAVPGGVHVPATDIIAAADQLMYGAKRSDVSKLLIETYAATVPQ